jgi:excisionase family DNA binding protein
MAEKEVRLEERHLSLSEAAAALDISERTAYRWIKSGKLRAYKPGRDYWIPDSAVKEVVAESRVRPKAPSRSLFEPSLNDALADERREAEHEALVRTFRAAAAFGRTVVESFKNFRPLDMKRLAAFHQLESALFAMRGRRDLFGRLPDDLADAIDALEEVSALVSERLNEHLDTSSAEERQKFERELRELERITA